MKSSQTVAILGASPKPDRYAYRAFEMLRQFGHRPVPINPAFDEILGEKCFPTINDAPKPIDTVTLYLGRRAPIRSLTRSSRQSRAVSS